jgi:hypothetical protein
MALTNETKYVTVRRLNRFKQKLDAKDPSALTASDVEDIWDEVFNNN